MNARIKLFIELSYQKNKLDVMTSRLRSGMLMALRSNYRYPVMVMLLRLVVTLTRSSPVGDIVREIVVNRIDPTIDGLQHAIEVRGDQFLICHADTNLHRVCITDNTGGVIESYGGKPGSGRYRLNGPVHLAVDVDENYLIADQHNNRILKLNRSLRYAEVPYDFREPLRVLVDHETGRLYLINGMSIETYDVSCVRDTPYPCHDDSDGEESRDFSDEDEAGND